MKRRKLLGDSLVLFEILFHHATGHQVLELLVGSESEHLFPTACGVSGFETFVDLVKKIFEFEAAS